MKIAIGSDHAGIEYRANIKQYLENLDIEVIDCGTFNETANYAVEGIKVAETVSSKNADLGIVICGSGVGISIAANKVRGIRCALAYNKEIASLSRQHNNANILALGARFISQDDAYEFIDAFLNTEFEGGRHEDRVHTITDYEESCVDC